MRYDLAVVAGLLDTVDDQRAELGPGPELDRSPEAHVAIRRLRVRPLGVSSLPGFRAERPVAPS